MVEAALLKELMRPHFCDLSSLSAEELDQLEQLVRKASGMKAEPSITDALDEQSPLPEKQDKVISRPRKEEMLGVLLRHETNLINELIKTLKLLHTLQAERAAAEAEANTIDR